MGGSPVRTRLAGGGGSQLRTRLWSRGIPCYQGKYREFHRFGPRWRVTGGQNGNQISALRANSLRVRTGNFLTPYRELNRPIRELFTVIRESRSPPPLFGLSPGDRGPLRLSPPWGLTRQPRSPERLGHRVAARGHGIAWAGARLGGSETFI